MKKRDTQSLRRSVQLFIYLILFVALMIVIGMSVAKSLFIKKLDRINLVFYGEKTAIYSLGKADNVNYFTYVYPDLKVSVPGGYGYYRIGALGKLISLEKEPDILRRAFSAVTASFVNYYFYPKTDQIYYGEPEDESVFLPGSKQIWLEESNASLLDRLNLWLTFAFAKRSDFVDISAYPVKNKQQDKLLDASSLAKRYQGFFYNRAYRDEKKTVQIIYTKDYESAATISQILEGSGVRVVDISQRQTGPKVCTITEVGESFSQTSKDLSSFFECRLVKGKSPVSDIILELGSQESAWSKQ